MYIIGDGKEIYLLMRIDLWYISLAGFGDARISVMFKNFDKFEQQILLTKRNNNEITYTAGCVVA